MGNEMNRKGYIGIEVTLLNPRTRKPLSSSASERFDFEVPPIIGTVLEFFGLPVTHIDEGDSIDDPNSDLNTRR